MSEIPEDAKLTPPELAHIEWPDSKETPEWLDWYVRSTANYKLARAIANAQLKKAAPIIAAQTTKDILKWAMEVCPHCRSDGDALDDYVATKRECVWCWAEHFDECRKGHTEECNA